MDRHLFVRECNVRTTLDINKDKTKIIHLSDAHFNFYSCPDNVKKFIQSIKEQEPDMIIFSGDMLSEGFENYDLAYDFFKSLSKIAPIYIIPGNHDKGKKLLDEEYAKTNPFDISNYASKEAEVENKLWSRLKNIPGINILRNSGIYNKDLGIDVWGYDFSYDYFYGEDCNNPSKIAPETLEKYLIEMEYNNKLREEHMKTVPEGAYTAGVIHTTHAVEDDNSKFNLLLFGHLHDGVVPYLPFGTNNVPKSGGDAYFNLISPFAYAIFHRTLKGSIKYAKNLGFFGPYATCFPKYARGEIDNVDRYMSFAITMTSLDETNKNHKLVNNVCRQGYKVLTLNRCENDYKRK